jgi:predicted DNA-binding transcriptional regulator YafY
MRASRLLQMLLLLQNRGKLTCAQLADELEVARRTVLRDVDALTEAGLPVVVHRGLRGGIELGFNYRTRLTGLARDEAEALGVLLAAPVPAMHELGLDDAAARARSKLLESLPDGVREHALAAQQRIRFAPRRAGAGDPRVRALEEAVRLGRRVRLRATTKRPRTIQPVALVFGAKGWSVIDALAPDEPIALSACGDINILAQRFAARGSLPPGARAE